MDNSKKQIDEIGDEYLQKSKQEVLKRISNFITHAQVREGINIDLHMIGIEGSEGKEEKRLFIIVRLK